jgi:3-oxoacyl-(acyl-carrier-protein) synthase
LLVIRAAAWFAPDDYGVLFPGGRSWKKPSPPFSAVPKILALIDRPVKYYSRMTTEARLCLCAASIALRGVSTSQSKNPEIGLLGAGGEGFLQANQEYFRDYFASGRTMGRGNLFIYTLPTSALGEVAIALSLGGPCMFLQDDSHPLASLIKQAEQLVADGEADLMLALWSNSQAALCMAVDADPGDDAMLAASVTSPLQLIQELQKTVQPA